MPLTVLLVQGTETLDPTLRASLSAQPQPAATVIGPVPSPALPAGESGWPLRGSIVGRTFRPCTPFGILAVGSDLLFSGHNDGYPPHRPFRTSPLGKSLASPDGVCLDPCPLPPSPLGKTRTEPAISHCTE